MRLLSIVAFVLVVSMTGVANVVPVRKAVAFVTPSSPVQIAGFKVGDKITLIDGKSAEAWPGISFVDLRYGPSGTDLVFTMQSGAVRHVKLADYF
jgi:membrane-associated protease RseP (regulator of RpoE activity)